LEEFATVRTVENFPEGKLVTVRVYPADPERPPVDEVMSFLRERNTKVNSVSVEKGLLDEVFRAITTAAAEEVGS
jgi:hypothetical protein